MNEIFSNREIAILIWMVVFSVFLLFKGVIKFSHLGILKSIFLGKIGILVASLIGYVALSVCLFYWLNFWDVSLLKDTLFWFFGVAIMSFFNVTKAKDFDYFKKIISDAVKWTIVLELLINLYSFSLPIELVIVPVFTILSIVKAVSESKKDSGVNDLLNKILGITGILLFSAILYKSVIHYDKLFNTETLKSLLISPILTLIFVPFLYLIALVIKYEELFERINFFSKNDLSRKKKLKSVILKKINFNLKSVIGMNSKIHRLTHCKIELFDRYFRKY